MRAIWKGAITFGLVNVPVKLYSATADHDVSLHQVHDADGGRIRYKRQCEVCEKIVKFENINKAYEEDDQRVILTNEDFESLPDQRSREIDVLEFVPSDQIDPIMFDKSYYLEPDSKSAKSYFLLRKVLEETERTAIISFALRNKTRLGALRVHEGALTVQTLLWEDEVRAVEFESLEQDVKLNEKEVEMAETLVDSFSKDFTPEEFTDEAQEQLRALIDEKLKQGDSFDTGEFFGEEEGEGAKVLDLMEALRKSVDRSENGKSKSSSSKKSEAKKASEDESGSEASAEKSPKKTSSKKAASKGSESRSAKSSGKSKQEEPEAKKARKPAAKKEPKKSA